MYRIENEQLSVTINPVGAEITSIYNKEDDFEYIWQGVQWPKHAPVLFPAIGRSNEGAYLIDGKTYEMPQHGFVADQHFTLESQTTTSLSLKLVANETTLQYYPYHFELIIGLQLATDQVRFTATVNNLENQDLSFSFGSHPAFNVPINDEGYFDDYQITFETPEDEIRYFEIVKTPNPYRSGKLCTLKHVENKTVPLTHKMFEKGLLIIENQLSEIKLTSEKSEHSIGLDLGDFKYLTLWTKEGADAPFLCLEPFYGLPDVVGDKRELTTKEANYHLAAKETASIGYTMTFK